MEFTGKKVLLNIVYYTLIAIMVAIGVSFLIILGISDIALFPKIFYFVLTILFVLLIIYDIICTHLNRMKFVSGIILYALSIATLVMTFILYGLNATRALIPTDYVNIFATLSSISLTIMILGIVIYCVGQKIVEYKTTR